jgi:hypothetical protein
MGKKIATCTEKAWCPGMSRSMEFSGKGLRTLTLADMKANDARRVATLFSGDFKKRGIIINYCPFCGTNLKGIHEFREPLGG